MEADILIQSLITEYMKQDINMYANEIRNKTIAKEDTKMFKSLMRTFRYYSKHGDYKNFSETLKDIDKKYFPKEDL